MTQLGKPGLGIIAGTEGGTGFDAGPDADKAVFYAQIALTLMRDGFLALVRGSNGFDSLSAGFARITVGVLLDHIRLSHGPLLVVFVKNAAVAEEGHGAVGIGDGSEAALENDTVEAADNAVDFIAESLYKTAHAPFSCDGFLLFTHNRRDQRRISDSFWKRQQRKYELERSAERSPMQACGEFGFPVKIVNRKSKASPGQTVRRRAKRYTRVCESAATGQMSLNRRLFRTTFGRKHQ